MASSALDRIRQIREKAEEEVKAIQAQAVTELAKQIGEAKEHLKSLEADYEQLVGKNVRGERVRRSTRDGSGPKADFSDAKELSALLRKSPDGRLNRKGINIAGYNLKSAIAIAKSDPNVFGFEQKKAQGSVWHK